MGLESAQSLQPLSFTPRFSSVADRAVGPSTPDLYGATCVWEINATEPRRLGQCAGARDGGDLPFYQITRR
jgi:hypothetical protein